MLSLVSVVDGELYCEDVLCCFLTTLGCKKNFSREGTKMRRFKVNKSAGARGFKADISRTKSPNMRQVMRGGWRM